MKKFYITTTLPYVNAEPHIGFALEIITADVLARFHKLMGDEVVFNTGTDEHGQKIYQQAVEQRKDPQDYCNEYAAKFGKLKSLLNLSYTNFIRTTNPHHISAAQEFWKLCKTNGYIDKQLYKVKYCVGCELEKTESELVNGRCPLHPNLELEIREEENYFFKFSAFEQPLLEFYAKTPHFVEPPKKFHEIQSFVTLGLQDFSISRLKAKMPWGIDVPGDNKHVMYVWFDALINYISTIGWPEDKVQFEASWPGVQIAGKDNLRQQSAMWQAMLMAAGLPNSEKILINGFISVNGQKMSKSLGNVISPSEMVKRYTIDGTRYLLLSLDPVNEDMDVSWDKFDQTYIAELANGLGNLAARILRLATTMNFPTEKIITRKNMLKTDVLLQLGLYKFNQALELIWGNIRGLDKYLSKNRPWEEKSEHKSLSKIVVMTESLTQLKEIAETLIPFFPDTAQRILSAYNGTRIKEIAPLFPRLQR